MATLTLREQILARLFEVVSGIKDVEAGYRFPRKVDDIDLPVVIMLDGGEERLDDEPHATGRAVVPMVMLPAVQLYFTTTQEELSTEANAWLAKLQKAVLFDTAADGLLALCRGVPLYGPHYIESSANMYDGKAKVGELNVGFAIRYAFNPAAL